MTDTDETPASPADGVEWRKVDRLVPYARNARTHSDEQVDQIPASIREWGWTVPLLVDESGTLIAGHGRLLAAQKLGLEQAPVMVAEGWSESSKRAYRLADNKLAQNAGWDTDMLTAELADLQSEGFEIGLVGWSGPELEALGLGDPDFGSGSEDEQGGLDSLDPKWIACPHCGKEFDANAQ